MSSIPDTDELKAKYAEIAALKKAINEKKMAKNLSSPLPAGYGGRDNHYNSNTFRGGYRGGYRNRYRGGYRGGYRGSHNSYINNLYKDNMHRNMSVVFNNNTNDNNRDDSKKVDSDSLEPAYVSSVSKSGMTLVNSDMYEKDKMKIIQRSEQAKQLQDQIKKKKKASALRAMVFKNQTNAESYDRVKISEDVYAVTNSGDDLILLSIPTEEKDENIEWNKKTYVRTVHGNLKCQNPCRGRYVFRSLYCSNFQLTQRRIVNDQCRYFTKTGLCQKGPNCKYKHDQSFIKLCRQYLSNNCHNKNCLLSHTPSQYNTPLCRYFLENKCVNPQCTYEHTFPKDYNEPNVEIWVCRPFSIGGSCPRGRKCPFMHLFICPDFQENGTCPRGKACTLAHSATLSTQRLMLSTDLQQTDAEVLIESDSEETRPRIVNSYTVDPSLLFERSRDGKYDIYIDKDGSQNEIPNSGKGVSSQDNSQFMIHLDSESEPEKDYDSDQSPYESELDGELDDLQENNDYIEFSK